MLPVAAALSKLPLRVLPDDCPFNESLLSTLLCFSVVYVLWRYAAARKETA